MPLPPLVDPAQGYSHCMAKKTTLMCPSLSLFRIRVLEDLHWLMFGWFAWFFASGKSLLPMLVLIVKEVGWTHPSLEFFP